MKRLTMLSLCMMVTIAAAFCFPVHAQQDPAFAKAAADAAYYEAMQKLGEGADAETRRLIAVAMTIERAAREHGGGGAAPTIIQREATGRTAWDVFASMALGTVQFMKEAFTTVAPIAGQVYLARTNARTQEVVAGYNRDTQLATVNGFVNLGTAGINGTRDAGIAGYPYVQAPGATSIGGNGVIGSGSYAGPVLSGTGVQGSGSYVGPVNRNCNGGAAGGGTPGSATVPGTPGGAGGTATC